MKQFKFTIEGNRFEVNVNEIDQNVAEVEVNGSKYTVNIEREEKATAAIPVRRPAAAPTATATKAAAPATATPTPQATGETVTITSPLPGSIVKVIVTKGQAIKKGDILLVMESMKMENNVMAENDGIVGDIFCAVGDSVMQDDKLISIEVSAASAPAPKATPAPAPAPKAAAPAPKVAAPVSGNAKPVASPLPGSIVKVDVSEGQAVKRGDVLLVMESMKMENNIMAEEDGTITSIKVAAGDTVMQDDVLLEMA